MNKKIRNILTVVIVAAALVLIFTRTLYVRIDLTKEGKYSLSDAAVAQLESMSEPLTIKLYLTKDVDTNLQRLRRATIDMIREMNLKSAYIIETDENDAEEAEKRGLRGMRVATREKSGKIMEQVVYPWVEVCGTRDTMAVCLLESSEGLRGETAVNRAIEDLEFGLTDAVRVLNRKEVKKIAILEGHGELTEEEAYDATEALSRYFQVDRGRIGTDPSELDEYAALIVARPREPYTEAEKYAIDQYIMRGGRVMWMIDGTTTSAEMLSREGITPVVSLNLNLSDMLFRYGARVTPTVLEDMQCSYMPVNIAPVGEEPIFEPVPWVFSPLLQTSPLHPVTRSVSAVKADFASAIEPVGINEKLEKTALLMTSNASHMTAAPAEIDVMGAVNKNPEKYFNTRFVPVAMVIEGEFESIYRHRMPPEGIETRESKEKSERTRIIIAADGDIMRNDTELRGGGRVILPLGYDRMTGQTYGNKDFVVNSMLYLTDDEGVMDLRNKKVELRLLNRAKVEKERTKWAIINTLAPLVALVLAGLIFGIIRRKKYKI